ncbi:ATP-binding protein [Bacillus songklensis]|uniref:ATP-binding protein n=1 Tax=Bacillus songklensis TaxID=1069116 RepID=A0ABV8BAH4_9BACI
MNKNTKYPADHSSASQDNVILEHYGLNELNFESIKNYRQRFLSVKPDHPWNGLETKDFLYKIGAWGKLRNTSMEGLTLAGLLMFSEERIITEVLPQYFLEYRENLTSIINGNWSKRFTSQDGTWSGNVYDFYFKVIEQLTSDFHEDMNPDHVHHREETLIRSSLHEALINTLVHADYYGEGGIIIEREKNFFQFSNPGTFLISVEQAMQGGTSHLLNPTLFKMFILIGLCKRAGSGLKSIDLTWRTLGGDPPELIQNTQSERIILTLSAMPRLAEKKERIKVQKEDEKQASIPGNNLLLTKNAENENSVNKETDSINKDENSLNKSLNSCNSDENSINKDIYSVNKSLNSVNNDDYSCNNGANSYNNEGNSYNNEWGSLDDVDQWSREEEDILKENDVEAEMIELMDNESESTEVESQLWEISEIARRKKRLSPHRMEEIIVKLVEKKPLMLKELASLLERTPDGLRNNYLTKLSSQGKIRLKYPDQPNHPRQAYMIAKKGRER